MLVALITVSEIGFWALLLGGLAARYLLRLERVSTAMLLATPVVDLALLGATAVDLHRGAEATPAHALAAIYLGIAVAYGSTVIAWVDTRFAHRFAGGPAPTKLPRRGPARARHELTMWVRHLLAYLVGTGLMYLAIESTGDARRTEVLDQATDLWTLLLALDLAVAISYAVRTKQNSPASPGMS